MLWLYLGLLLLASTRFGVVSWIWGKWAWSWDYFECSFQNGWGYQFESDFSFLTVLAYLAAFAAGVAGCLIAGKRIATAVSVATMTLCVLGMISFLIEGSHWIWEHHLSWIAICPAANLLLAAIAIVQLNTVPDEGAAANIRDAA